jgi:ELWxxDGT repeat protein
MVTEPMTNRFFRVLASTAVVLTAIASLAIGAEDVPRRLRSVQLLGSFTAWNGTVFFTAGVPDTGHEIWMTDGTTAGTVLAKDFNPGPSDGSVGVSVGNRFRT